MKKTTLIGMAILMLGISTLSTGCFGSFSLTRKLYDMNKSIGNKFGQSVVLWVFLIVPVYEVCAGVDFIILNLIEFWSGSNPLAMKPGEKDSRIVKAKDGKQYVITATQNRFDITASGTGDKTALVYAPQNNTWSIEKNGLVTRLATIHEDINKVEIYHADGSVSLHDINYAQVNALLQAGLSD